MLLKHLKLANSLFVAVYFLFPSPVYADEFQFFTKGVDYWNDQKEKGESPAITKVETLKEAPKNETTFPWANFLDPKNKEFFREGDYLPPEPFMELVRNPSDENIKMWFAYMDRKNELAQRLELKVAQYAEKNGLAETETKQIKAHITQTVPATLDSKRYRFRMYFSSSCPHCQKMMATMNELQSKGFFVEAKQIDTDKRIVKLPFPSEMASKTEISQKGIQSVPLLLVGDLKNKVVYRLSGYQSTENVLNALAQNETQLVRAQ